ncbi:sirohydrochlorin chelatase [Microbacterium sp. SLBN-146]|uniref:sirohydrochlorin chelatase n=1 Tax=Microbacterium sp. SLBN-146 TaxID=2768457 RepID=UPI00115462CE|nr:CbiX/SirB N-terminal domain-containing protein [Microbacterium sp. SLBN-146]TQJ30934.1 sirohydrochlorin ferrochelatase [Microbacterium sp. SLBN-146]
MSTTLVACSHGTNSSAGRLAVTTLVEGVAALLPDVRVREAFVDVQDPHVAEVVDAALASGTAVVVPLLLSTGYHTKVDIARAVGAHPGRAAATRGLGPHPLLTDILCDRLRDVGLVQTDAVVLAAAGSSDPEAAVDTRATAADLARRLDRPVTVGFAAGAGPDIGTAVSEARSRGASRVVVASYVLAPGYFADLIARSGADVATMPLAPDSRLAEIVAQRFRDSPGRHHL